MKPASDFTTKTKVMAIEDLLLSLRIAGEAMECGLVDRRSGDCIASGSGPLPPEHFETVSPALGRALAASGLPAALRRALQSRLEAGDVRLGLDLDASVPAHLPWECLWTDFGIKGPLCQDSRIHLYRHAKSESATVRRAKEGAPRILVAVANPGSPRYPHLPSAAREADSVIRALNTAENRRLDIRRLNSATPRSLAEAIYEVQPDVFHFVGHGDWSPTGGKLVLESGRLAPGGDEDFYADDLAAKLIAAGTRLVVLSGCLTAGVAGSVGAELVRHGVPAVIGMSSLVGDDSAHYFARAFYAGLAEGLPIETAVAQARGAIRGTEDWAAPLLTLSCEVRLTDTRPKPRHNIPADDRTFVGRVKERSDLAGCLLTGEARLITLTGMGGMGKTRLAKRAGLDVVGQFSGGVWLIECEALSINSELLPTLGAALGIDALPLTLDSVLEHLADRHILLVFDCFERIVDQSGLLVEILRRCPNVRMLVTSRVLLSVEAESEFVLSPMSGLGRNGVPAEATDLFLRSAKHARADFELRPKNRRLVEELIRDLEAVPLALVLAASRLRHMDLAVLAERVRTRKLDTLTRRPFGANDRHADVRRVVADSLELLFEADRDLLRALAVFQGGFFSEDAWAVVNSDIEEGLIVLREHSLLMTHVARGATRYRILDTVRECLEEMVIPLAVEERHADCFAEKATEVRRLFDTGEYAYSRDLLWVDVGNFSRAIRFAIRQADGRRVQHFARCLARVYFEAGSRREFEALVNAASELPDADPQLLIELYGLRGELYKREGRPKEAEVEWRRRAALCEAAGDQEGQADSLLDIAATALEFGDLTTVEEALDAVSSIDLAPGPVRASAPAIRAKLRLKQGHSDEAVALCEAVEAEMQTVTSDRNCLFLWIALAQVYRGAGRPDDSARLCHRLVREAIEFGHHLSVGKALLELAEASLAKSRYGEAAAALAAASRMPSTVSSDLQKKIQTFIRKTRTGPLEAHLQVAESEASAVDWTVLAGRLPNPYTHP